MRDAPSGRPDRGRRAAAGSSRLTRRRARRHPGRAHARPPSPRARSCTSLRWVDFIPACDVELKRQAGEASQGPRRRGAVRVHQRQRPAAAHHRGHPVAAAAPTSSTMLHNWPHLYENGLVDVSDLAEWQAQGPGRLLRPVRGRTPRWAASFMALPHSIVPGLIAYRKSWFDEVGATTFPKTLRGAAPGRGMKLKKKGHPLRPDPRPHLRRRAGAGPTRCCGTSAAMETDKSGKTALDSKGAVEAVKFMTGVLEGRLRRGRPGLGRHQQQPRLPRRRDQRHAERRLDLHRGQARPGQDQGRQGRAAGARHPARAPARRARPARGATTRPSRTRS